jgi:3-isopropylmalate dehydrogenase
VPNATGWRCVEEGLAGGCAIDRTGTPLPVDVLERARTCDAVLLGAVGGPKWDDPNAAVRPEQALLACARSWACSPTSGPSPWCRSLIDAAPLKAEILAASTSWSCAS